MEAPALMMDDASFASMARCDYLTGSNWLDHYRIGAFAWIVPVEYRKSYLDIYVLSLVKGVMGEIADTSLEL